MSITMGLGGLQGVWNQFPDFSPSHRSITGPSVFLVPTTKGHAIGQHLSRMPCTIAGIE